MNKTIQSLKEVGRKKLIALFFLIATLTILVLINIYINTRDISGVSNVYSQPTMIYDQYGEIASKISGSKIHGVQFEEIPEHLISAVVSIEDRRFYKHAGIDYIGISRAMLANLKAGEVVAGGSTITQQLTKNVLLSHEQTFKRKWEEFFLAQKIERTFSKNEIIEMYLNQIYFGEGAWGIQNAADNYFGKNVDELTISESATLAGLIKAPSRLSPLKDYEKSVERRNIVLATMKTSGFISNSQYDQAMSEEIPLQEKQVDEYEGKYPYYVDHIIEEAIQEYGLTQNEILSGGLHVYTELDQRMQTEVEKVFNNDQLFPSGTTEQIVQGGSVLLDAKSGGIRALVGGRGEHVFRGFNHATQLERQPGSTMKPLAVYTSALENGYGMNSILPDQPININGYQPKNFNGGYKGQVTLFDAIKSSDNVPAVWLLNELGVDRGIEKVEEFGIPLTKDDRSLPLALGGLNGGVAPIQMAQAYSAFPNDGQVFNAHVITKITDSKGTILAELQENSVQVTTPEVAQTMTYMLKAVVEEGTGKNAKLKGRELAGKTGSTQVPIEGVNGTKDQWFVGFTPEIVGALWIGFDKTDKKHYLTTTSGQTAANIFKEIVGNALTEVPPTTFNLSLVQKPSWPSQYQENNNSKKEEKAEGRNNEEKKSKERNKENEKQKGKGRGKEKKKDDD